VANAVADPALRKVQRELGILVSSERTVDGNDSVPRGLVGFGRAARTGDGIASDASG